MPGPATGPYEADVRVRDERSHHGSGVTMGRRAPLPRLPPIGLSGASTSNSHSKRRQHPEVVAMDRND